MRKFCFENFKLKRHVFEKSKSQDIELVIYAEIQLIQNDCIPTIFKQSIDLYLWTETTQFLTSPLISPAYLYFVFEFIIQ